MDKHIKYAQAVCNAERADGVIVAIIYSDGQYRTVSYGRTKALCKKFGAWCDKIHEWIQTLI